jgi:hypothetical protein
MNDLLRFGGFFVFCFVLFCFFWFFCVALAVLELNSVDQAALELRNPPASDSQALGLKVCAPPRPAPLPSSNFLEHIQIKVKFNLFKNI